MIKRYFKILFSSVLALSVAMPIGARSIRDFFLTESGDVFKALPSNRRADMLAYYDVGRLMPTTGNFGEKATLEKVTDSYLKVTTSEASDVQMKLLKSGRDTMILVINTVKIPACDSRIRLFTKDWKELSPTKAIKQPKMEDFIAIPKGSKVKKADILGQIRFPIISYTADSVSNVITAHQELKDFMSKEDYRLIEPFLKKELVLKLK